MFETASYDFVVRELVRIHIQGCVVASFCYCMFGIDVEHCQLLNECIVNSDKS